VGTGIDTLRANVELQNEKQRLIEAENDRETSLFGLSRLLNLDPRQAIELADSLSFFDTPSPKLAEHRPRAAERQEWKALESQIKAAEYQKKAAQDSRLRTCVRWRARILRNVGKHRAADAHVSSQREHALFTAGGYARKLCAPTWRSKDWSNRKTTAEPDRAGRENGAAEPAIGAQ